MPEARQLGMVPFSVPEVGAALPDAKHVQFDLLNEDPYELRVTISFSVDSPPVVILLGAMPASTPQLIRELHKADPTLHHPRLLASDIDQKALDDDPFAGWGDDDNS